MAAVSLFSPAALVPRRCVAARIPAPARLPSVVVPRPSLRRRSVSLRARQWKEAEDEEDWMPVERNSPDEPGSLPADEPGSPPPDRPTHARLGEDYLVKKVSGKELEAMLKEDRAFPLIVDFYATWCGPCILMAQQFEMLAVEYDGVAEFVKVDTDEEYELAQRMQVRGLPTVYYFSTNKKRNAVRTEGLMIKEAMADVIDALFD